MSSLSSEFALLFSSPPNDVDRGGTGGASRTKRRREAEEKVTNENRKSKSSRQEHCEKNQRDAATLEREHMEQEKVHCSGFAEQRKQKHKAVDFPSQSPARHGVQHGKKPGMTATQNTGQQTNKKSKKRKETNSVNRGQRGQQPGHPAWRSGVNGLNRVKKQPYLSPEFISQHAIERDGRLFCKFFLSGRCIKEEACRFEHEFIILDKKQELCKFYTSGFCTKGADCIFMHMLSFPPFAQFMSLTLFSCDYPCKFFHTGTKCYQGDKCRFSHDPLTEVTRPLLEKVLNKKDEDVEIQENSVPSATVPPCLPAENQPLCLGLRPNFYNSSSAPEGPPVSRDPAVTPAESLFLPLPSLELPLDPSSCSPPAVPPKGCDAEVWSSEGKAECLQHRAAEPFCQGGSGQEDMDTDSQLKDIPAVIPLDLLPGVVLKDPRHSDQHFSEVSLSRPAFAGTTDSMCRDHCISTLGSSTQQTLMANPGDETPDTPVLAEVWPSANSVDPLTECAASTSPSCTNNVCYQNCAVPAVHNLPVRPVATLGCQPRSAPPQTKTQSKTSTVFQDIFKNPLPLLSASDTDM
ncbi:zinc finger CCCH domain-containing protein 8 [Arapaima gigas]